MEAYKKQIEYLCDLVERFLDLKHVPCQINGGTISHEHIQLFITPNPHVWKKHIFQAIPPLALYLGMNDMRRGEEGGFVMDIPVQGMMAVWGDRHLLPRQAEKGVYVFEPGGDVWEA